MVSKFFFGFFLLAQMCICKSAQLFVYFLKSHLTVRKSAFELYKLQRNISSSHIPYLTCKQKKKYEMYIWKSPFRKDFSYKKNNNVANISIWPLA